MEQIMAPTPALTLEQAREILDTVLDAGLFEPPIPTDGAEILDTAANVVKSAANAKRLGNSNRVIQKVLDLASPLQNVPAFDNINDTPIPSTAPLQENGDIDRWNDESPATRDSLAYEEFVATNPKGTATGNNLSREDTAAKSTDSTQLQPDREKESSHYLDHNNKIEIPDLPRDFSKVGDLELRTLHAERHGILSKVIFELGLETSDYESAQMNYDETFKRVTQLQEGDTVTERKDKAFIQDPVMHWRQKIDQHHKKVIMLRAYRELLESEIKGLSREFTMRTGERNTTP